MPRGGTRPGAGRPTGSATRPSKRRTRDAAAREVTAAKQRAFLDAYQQRGTILGAAQATGMDRATHYRWLKQAAYQRAFEEAEVVAIEYLEQMARQRALVGAETPIYYKGQQVGTRRDPSDALLMFLLKGKKPQVYRDHIEHSGPAGQAFPIRIVHQELADEPLPARRDEDA